MTAPDADSFATLSIRPELLSAITDSGYHTMTPVQTGCLPTILANRDVIAQAKTGSGKTAAFAIGILSDLNIQSTTTQAIVLCPTRELAEQVARVIRQLSAKIANTKVLTLCGGKPMQGQLASLQHSPHIVVGTPGRILKHLNKETLDVSLVRTVVLDEADRMLDMGFREDITKILNFLNNKRQTLLFSATFPDSIHEISSVAQNNPEVIRVDTTAEGQIEQVLYQADDDKSQLLIRLLRHHQPESCIVFCNQKKDCQELTGKLTKHGFYALQLHGDLDQYQRDQAIVQFDNQSCSLLVATDVAARGLDIKELSAVINYDITPDPEVHVHRIGRTGRAGSTGLAITLTHPSEANRVNAIEDYQEHPLTKKNISDLKSKPTDPARPPMVTLQIRGGRKDKIRPGDIVGALTANAEISGDQIGKISIGDKTSFVAVQRNLAKPALGTLSEGKIKGRKYRASVLGLQS